MAKAAQPLRAAQVKWLKALHLDPAAALHIKQLQLRARGSKRWAHQREATQERLTTDLRMILLEGCMTAAAFLLQAAKRMLHTCCATMSTSASSPVFTK